MMGKITRREASEIGVEAGVAGRRRLISELALAAPALAAR